MHDTPVLNNLLAGFPSAGTGWLAAAALLALTLLLPSPTDAQAISEEPVFVGYITVYLLDHQYLPIEELATITAEIDSIFREAGIAVQWVPDDSPRRKLEPTELRVIILPSDGTRWFHGPSNVIGIAPHDHTGIGRNCFVFYRQAIWFRQQTVLRCREAIQARIEAKVRGVPLDPYIESLAPADCGDRLASLTAMIVARAAAHEMVHILLNKLDHSPRGLMRTSFDISEWMVDETDHFRLGSAEIVELQSLMSDHAGGAQ